MFWFHAIALGEGGPAISWYAHWLLDSTFGFIALTPALFLIIPFAAWAAHRLAGDRVGQRPWLYVALTGGLFALVTVPGPIAHDLFVARGHMAGRHRDRPHRGPRPAAATDPLVPDRQHAGVPVRLRASPPTCCSPRPPWSSSDGSTGGASGHADRGPRHRASAGRPATPASDAAGCPLLDRPHHGSGGGQLGCVRSPVRGTIEGRWRRRTTMPEFATPEFARFHDAAPDDFELEERNALRRVAGLSTELADVTEVEYRQLRLERVVLVGRVDRGHRRPTRRTRSPSWPSWPRPPGSQVLEGLIQRRSRPDPSTFIGRGKVDELRAVVLSTRRRHRDLRRRALPVPAAHTWSSRSRSRSSTGPR